MAKQTYHARKSAGLCVDCGIKPATGTVRCFECAEIARARNRLLHKTQRQTWRASGLCIGCGSDERIHNLLYCQTCRNTLKNYHQTTLQKKHAAGICNNGGCKNTVAPNRLSCQTCLDKAKCRVAAIPPGICRSCYQPSESGKTICNTCLDKRRKRRQKIREIVFRHYGGFNCKCCGESQQLMLAIDHIHNNGNEHRKQIGHRSHCFYMWLYRHNFPEGYQILCHNCNYARFRNGGICPHQQTNLPEYII